MNSAQIEFDPSKNEQNIAKHGISFDRVCEFVWDSAVIVEDTRDGYPEPRFIATGFVRVRLHVLVFTTRKGKLRVISFRKANKREVRRYENEN